MSGPSKESSPNSPTTPNADPNVAVHDHLTGQGSSTPVQVQVGEGSSSVPVRVLRFGEGSSAVSVTQECIDDISSTSSSSDGRSPPRRVLQIALGGMKTSSGYADKEKTGNKGEVVGEKKKRKKAEMDAPTSDPICHLCGKRFGSWKAVFGHLRAHPERQYRGAFPPPKAEPGSLSQFHIPSNEAMLLPQILLDLARETVDKMNDESTPTVRNFDLNKEPSSPIVTDVLDLNKSPPKDDEDEKKQ